MMSAIAQPGKLLPPPEPPCCVPGDWVEVLDAPRPEEAVESMDILDEREALDSDFTDASDAVDANEPVERVASTEFGNAVSVISTSRHMKEERQRDVR